MDIPAFLKKPARTQKILIADDEKVNIYILRKILIKHGYEVHSVENGREAIDRVGRDNFDTVLLDVMMPEVDGFEAAEIIHEMKPELPIVILTALIDDESIKTAFESGAIDYLKKPVNESELISRVKNAIKIKQAEERYKTMYSEMVNDLDMASEIQLNLLPQWLISRNGFVTSSLYDPSNKIGGDLFDVIHLSDTKQLIYMGDISGHGVQAALLMTALKSIINMIVTSNPIEEAEPYKIITKLSKLFSRRLFSKNYVTLLMIQIDLNKQNMKVFNAGHPPMICYNKQTSKAEVITHKGSFPVGWMADMAYLEEDQDFMDFPTSKNFLLYTDGIFECVDETLEQLGIEGLRKIVEEVSTEDEFYLLPHKIKEKLMRKNFDFHSDDFAILQFQNIKNHEAEKKKILHMRSELINVRDVGNNCMKIISGWVSCPSLLLKSEIIISEYLNNIIIHGLRDREDVVIFMELSYCEKIKKIKIRFYDKGVKWDMATRKQEKKDEGMGEVMKNSGYGLNIIDTLCDDFFVRRICDINETTILVASKNKKGVGI